MRFTSQIPARQNRLSKSIVSRCILILLALSGCNQQLPAFNSSPSAALTDTPSASPQPEQIATAEPSATPTTIPTLVPTDTTIPTATPTSTETLPPTETASPTIPVTPTPEFPVVKVLMRAFCRYGPGKAYLYSHELKEGDPAQVHGRNYSGTWLWIQPENLDRHCWMAASVAEVTGDVSTAPVVQTRLPQSTLYGPPGNIQSLRDGDLVLITWEPVWMTEDDDRGYLIEATVCQNGQLVSLAVQTDTPSYEFTDEQTCSGSSGGMLYTVEKHGYTTPVPIPWP